MIDLVLCASGRDEVRIVHDLAQAGGGARVVRRCADLAETLAAAAAGVADAVVLDLTVRGLNREHLETIGRSAVVVGLVPSHHDPDDLPALAHRVPADADVGTLLGAVVAAMESEDEGPWESTDDNDQEEGAAGGRLLAVWGPTGSTGRSTIAMNLAAEAALAGTDTVLVDADTQGPSLTQMLGVLEEGPGLLAACRAQERGAPTEAPVEEILDQVRDHLRLLGGIGIARRWPEVGASALGELWHRLRRISDLTVVDVAPLLDGEEEHGHDAAAPRRSTAARSAIRASDAVLAVVTADPVSITRLLRERDRLQEAGASTVHVIVNRVGAPVPEDSLGALIRDRMDPASLHVLPDDPAACRRAAWDGALLSESAPRSPLRRALRELVADAGVIPAAMGQ